MFQRKLIAVLGLVTLLAFTAGVSQASKSRVEGMGLGIPTLSQYTDDYVNIYFYPTSVVRQNNLVLAEMGNNPSGGVAPVGFSDQSFTIIRNFPRFGAIAYDMKATQLNDPFASNLTHHQLDLIWGKAFTKIDFAVRVDITNSSFEETSSGGTVSFNKVSGDGFSPFDPYPFGGAFFPGAIADFGVEMNTWGITPALAIHMQNDNRIEGAVTYRNYSLERTESAAGVQGEKWEDDGSASYAVVARAILNQNDKHTWIPAGFYVNSDLSWATTNVPAVGDSRSAEEKYKAYAVGISDNMKVNDNNLLLWGIQLMESKHTFERGDAAVVAGETSKLEERFSSTPIIFAALETDATRWLKVRMGASQSYISAKSEEVVFGAPATTTTDEFHGSDFAFSLGTGIRWNNLDIDMTLNEKFPLSGGWVMSGDPSTPFTRASATYHF